MFIQCSWDIRICVGESKEIKDKYSFDQVIDFWVFTAYSILSLVWQFRVMCCFCFQGDCQNCHLNQRPSFKHWRGWWIQIIWVFHFTPALLDFSLSWVNMAAVLTVLLGYHLETPGLIITWIKDHAVPPASHHGDTGSVSGPDGVRFMLDKVVLRHVFSSILVLPCHWNFTSSLCSFIYSYLTNDCHLSIWQLIKHIT